MVAIIFLIVCGVIVFSAIRIILRWTVPAPALARFDRAFSHASNFVGKIIVVALAAGIVTLFVAALRR